MFSRRKFQFSSKRFSAKEDHTRTGGRASETTGNAVHFELNDGLATSTSSTSACHCLGDIHASASANGCYAEKKELLASVSDKNSKRRATVAAGTVASAAAAASSSRNGRAKYYRPGASRDFPVAPISSSVASHDSCMSLKDQFLRIKERCSGNNSSKSTNKTVPATTITSSSTASEPSTCVNELPSAPTPAQDLQQQPTQRHTQLEEELLSLNAEAKRLFPNDPWPHNLERWILEETCLRGYMTCWTIEVGAQLISVIATIAKGNASLINPDLSLQWIGRQLWGLTIQLPLTRSGELSHDHIALASEIDKAISETLLSHTNVSIPRFNTVLCPDATIIPYMSCNNQLPTLRDESETNESININEDVAVHPLPSGQEQVHPDDIDIEQLAKESETMSLQQDVANPSDSVFSFSALQLQQPSSDRSEVDQCGVVSRNAFDINIKRSASMGRLVEEEGVEEEDDTGSVRSEDMKEDSSNRSSNVSCNSSDVSSPPSSASSKTTGIAWTMLSKTSENENGDPNEDFLERIAPQKTGWLRKRTGLNTWQLRWFELKGNCLCYFATEKDGIPRGAIVLDGVHVLRAKGTDNVFTFTITTSNEKELLQIIKFTSRLTHQSYHRRTCVLRLVEEKEEEVVAWVSALNRASFCCHLSIARPYAKMRTSKSSTPSNPFYRLRSTSAMSKEDLESKRESSLCLHHYGSVAYLQNTNPLLWEINPKDQAQIRKKALLARTKADYTAILTKFHTAFRRIFLPRPRPISLDQTLRDIIPELFLINNILYGGDTSNNLENIFEVLDCYVKRFAWAPEERVRVVSTILQACARTICGGDSYFVVHSLLGNDAMIIRPAEARGMPIEIEISSTNAFLFCIRVSSVFCFHSLEQVEACANEESSQEPLLKVHTCHVQEFDFQSGKSTRWLRIRADGMKDALANAQEDRKSLTSESDYGALLDPLG